MFQTVSKDFELNGFTSKVNFQSRFINFCYRTSILYFERKIHKLIQKEDKIFFKNDRKQWFANYVLYKKQRFVWENNSSSTIIDFSIQSKKQATEVFYLKSLPPNKAIILEFNREGVYTFNYWLANTQKIITGTIKVLFVSDSLIPQSNKFNHKLSF